MKNFTEKFDRMKEYSNITSKILFRLSGYVVGYVIATLLYSKSAYAISEMSIVDVKRNIPLADSDPTFRDYYLNAGTDHGLKRNMVVKVTRKVSMRDVTGTHTFGDLVIPVGYVKILFVQDKISVARDFEIFSRDEFPNIDHATVMIGDKFDIVGSFIDNDKKAAKKSSQKQND